jgi:hypothetical protein
MSKQNPPMKSLTPSNCDPSFMPSSVTLTLDAPFASIATDPLPKNFRTMQNIPNISGTAASGSAQYSALQLQSMINHKAVEPPLVMVDLRQESHGFLKIESALNDEHVIAVSWFAERDWSNVDKGLPSIMADEGSRLANAAQTSDLTVYEVLTKSLAEDAICTAKQHTVQPTDSYTEQEVVQKIRDAGYLRLPSTDHCQPRDPEVDQFVAFEAALAPNTWLHFHCRAGDGRTTTFLAMHDIIHNAPGDSLSAILTRQGPSGIGGVDLAHASKDQKIFDYPFSAARVAFMQNFYTYVCQAKPGGFKLVWSEWVTRNLTRT